MTALTSTVANFELAPNSELKVVVFQTRDDVDATDTYAVTLSDYGISATGLLIVEGWVHTTSGSVIAPETVTTSVASGVLTITVPGGSNNDVRIFRITGTASAPTYAA
jgi:hypothetical protein